MLAPVPELPEISELGRTTQRRSAGSLLPHRNRGIEICAIHAGRLRWQVEGQSWDVETGQAFVTLPWQWHGGEGGVMHRSVLDFVVIDLPRCGAKGSWSYGDCPLDVAARRFVTRSLRENLVPVIADGAAIAAVFERLWSELRTRRPGWQSMVRGHLAELLLSAARAVYAPAPEGASDPAVSTALHLIAQRLDEPWQLDDMAAAAGIARTRFAERVQAATGMSPHRWLLRTRLERAQAALRYGTAPITSIALDCGFASSQHFAGAFRREFGCTASAWRAGSL
ncbi:MAG: AraC family transcriptional regulator [Planctomycetota bacterium]|jgi:AraC-like DNA-binding protein|nr:AraC family transcriptional regulator [Planctomycetota bacterium]